MKGPCATVVGVFRGFFKICSPAGQENFGFPALSFCYLGVFLPISYFCSLFVLSIQMRNMGKREQNRKYLPKTPNLPFHSPESLQNSLSEGEQNSQNSSKTPKRIRRGKMNRTLSPPVAAIMQLLFHTAQCCCRLHGHCCRPGCLRSRLHCFLLRCYCCRPDCLRSQRHRAALAAVL